jgi:hypothetical protein
MRAFIKELGQRDKLLGKFDEELWNAAIEAVSVYGQQKLCFIFKDDRKLEWGIYK